MRIARTAAGFIAAVLTAAVLGTAFNAWVNMGLLERTGIAVPAADRFAVMAHDVVAMGPVFAGLVAVGFAIAFLAGGLLARITGLRAIVFAVAGAVALIAIPLAMQAALGVQPIGGARALEGLAALGVAGALGGLAFALIAPHSRAA